MILELKRRGIEVCDVILTYFDQYEEKEVVKNFKGNPSQVLTWSIYHGVEREKVLEMYESLFEEDGTYARMDCEEETILVSNENSKVEKVKDNVIFVNFKQAA